MDAIYVFVSAAKRANWNKGRDKSELVFHRELEETCRCPFPREEAAQIWVCPEPSQVFPHFGVPAIFLLPPPLNRGGLAFQEGGQLEGWSLQDGLIGKHCEN